MRLQINDQIFEVDVAPMKEKAVKGILDMIQSREKDSDMLRMAVKAACTLALSKLNISKPDRNSDPIELVSVHLADLLFTSMESAGIALKGELVPVEDAKGAV